MASNEAIQMGAEVICSQIKDCLEFRTGCIIGRNGTIELQTLLSYRKYKTFSSETIRVLEQNAGVFPQDHTLLVEWVNEYLEANRISDIIAAGWYKPLEKQEFDMLAEENKGGYACVPLRSLEPYYMASDKRWTSLLSGRKVCVVSSFTKTMSKQLINRHLIWDDAESFLPTNTHFSFVQTGYSPVLAQGSCGWNSCKSWKDAVSQVYNSVMQTDAEIVLIGCGGLGLPLAQRLKKSGKITIVLGGAIQVLFGIKGDRWKNHSVISKFWNDYWVYPSPEETPRGAHSVENACYWNSR